MTSRQVVHAVILAIAKCAARTVADASSHGDGINGAIAVYHNNNFPCSNEARFGPCLDNRRLSKMVLSEIPDKN